MILESAVERLFRVQQIDLDSVSKKLAVTYSVVRRFFEQLDESRCCAINSASTADFRMMVAFYFALAYARASEGLI